MKDLTGIVIPTGNVNQDLERADIAIKYAISTYGGSKNVNYIITGMGPNANDVVMPWGDYSPNFDESRKREYDFHFELWESLIRGYKQGNIGIFCVDTCSLNSRENLINTFPLGSCGRYAVVSYPLHLLRLGLLENELKRDGLMSKDVELVHIPTKPFLNQSFKEFVYGFVHLIKYFLSA